MLKLLSERKVGPCEILKRANDNVYQLFKTSNAFNIKHWVFYTNNFPNNKGPNS